MAPTIDLRKILGLCIFDRTI